MGRLLKFELKGPAALRWRLGWKHHRRIGARSRGNPRLTRLPSLPAVCPCVGIDQSHAPACQRPLSARRIVSRGGKWSAGSRASAKHRLHYARW